MLPPASGSSTPPVAVAERDGVDGLTTRSIVAEAGVSAGMFYGHFESKESLLAAVVDHKTDELTTLVHAELEPARRWPVSSGRSSTSSCGCST